MEGDETRWLLGDASQTGAREDSRVADGGYDPLLVLLAESRRQLGLNLIQQRSLFPPEVRWGARSAAIHRSEKAGDTNSQLHFANIL
jgi:hypothetical protein